MRTSAQATVEDLEIAEKFEIEITDCTAQAEMKNSIFQNIIEELNESNSYQIIGDPPDQCSSMRARLENTIKTVTTGMTISVEYLTEVRYKIFIASGYR